jgi:hypothetical protein
MLGRLSRGADGLDERGQQPKKEDPMSKTKKQDDATRCGRIHKPIVYDVALDRSFDGWAEECHWQPDELRRASEQAIRTRHDEAEIPDESYAARGRQPDIWHLSLGNVTVIYTIETHAVVIRGYCWDLDREPLDDFDGGGHYCDYEWTLPA